MSISYCGTVGIGCGGIDTNLMAFASPLTFPQTAKCDGVITFALQLTNIAELIMNTNNFIFKMLEKKEENHDFKITKSVLV